MKGSSSKTILGWDYIMGPDCSDRKVYHADIIVFYTDTCALWNLGNLMLAQNFEIENVEGAEQGYMLDTSCPPVKIPGFTDTWVKWPMLLNILQKLWPHADHRLTWWCGQEVGMH